MGEVYLAHDTRLHRDVAVKVLPAAFAESAERLQRFEQEARATATLNHPNVMAVFDVGVDSGVPYVVLELLEGRTLAAALSQGALSPRAATDLAGQIAQGLAAAHGKGIVHRDLKPDNIFVTADGRAKILDFGLAKLIEGPEQNATVTHLGTTPPTGPGHVLGTAGYMAPEQVRGEAADHRADIFAFGAVFYEMLSGRPAFGGDTTVERMTAILKDDPPALPPGAVPPHLDRVVHRCLEKSPAQRFQSARDIAFALEAMSTLSTPAADLEAASVAPTPARRRWLPFALAAAVVGGVAIGAVATRQAAAPAPSGVRDLRGAVRSTGCRSPTRGSCPTAGRSCTARRRADRRRSSSSSTQAPKPRSRSGCRTRTCSRSRAKASSPSSWPHGPSISASTAARWPA